MYLKNTWYVAALDAEVSRTPLSRTLLGERVMLFRGERGGVHAIGDLCPHRFASLSSGKLHGDIVECPYHGLQFAADGVCIRNPNGNGIIPGNARVKAYPVVVRYGYVWVWIGEPSFVELNDIPDFSALARDDWAYFDGYLHIAADYQLIVDNLLDLSHIQFLHPFLSSPEWVAQAVSTVEERDGIVYGTNRAVDIPTFPVWKLVSPGIADRGEHWLDFRWSAPSHVYLDIRWRATGVELFAPNSHFMTPAEEGHTHYFYRIGRSERVADTELHAKLSAKVAHAFAHEDEPMIAQQQRNIGERDLLDLKPVMLATDAGAIRARRALARRIQREHGLTFVSSAVTA